MKLKFLLEGGYKIYCGTKEELVGTGWEIVTELGSDELFLKSSDRLNSSNNEADTYPTNSITSFDNHNTSTENYTWSSENHAHDTANSNNITVTAKTEPNVSSSSHSHTPNPNNINTYWTADTTWGNLTESNYNNVTASSGNTNYRVDGSYTRNGNTTQNMSMQANDGNHNHANVTLNRGNITNSGGHTHGWGGNWDSTTRPAATKIWLIRYTR